MFSFLPPFLQVSTSINIPHMPKAFFMHHSQVDKSSSYVSFGELRRGEEHCIFHYTVKGHGETWYKGQRYRTSPGTGFFNIINESSSGYGYPENETEPWEFVVVSFDGGNTREIVRQQLQRQVIYSLQGKEDAFRLMCLRLSEQDPSEIALIFLPKLLYLIEDCRNPLSPISLQFQHIAKRDVMLNPTIATIAAEIGVSREHLSRVFIKDTNTAPAEFLNKLRFEKLCYLLSTQAREEQIARDMNFASVASMAAFFKKYAGLTPRKYRSRGYVYL